MAGTGKKYIVVRVVLVMAAVALGGSSIWAFLQASSAVGRARQTAVAQARSVATGPLESTFTSSDVAAPVEADRQKALTQKITSGILQPSGVSAITIFNSNGTDLFSTIYGNTGQQLLSLRSRLRTAEHDGSVAVSNAGVFSVYVPAKIGETTVIAEIDRPWGPIGAHARPWYLLASLMTVLFVCMSLLIARVARMAASAAANASFRRLAGDGPVTAHATPGTAAGPAPKSSRRTGPGYTRPGFHAEEQARHEAEARAKAAEERAGSLEQQYRSTLEELHSVQKALEAATSASPTRPDPAMEDRLLKSEGRVRLLEGQLQAMTGERDRLAEAAAQPKETKPDPSTERQLRQVEHEAIALRAELEGARLELSRARGELDKSSGAQSRAEELATDLVAAREEVSHLRAQIETNAREASQELDALRTSATAQLEGERAAGRAEFDDYRARAEKEFADYRITTEKKLNDNLSTLQHEFEDFRKRSEIKYDELKNKSAAEITSLRAQAERASGFQAELDSAQTRAAQAEQALKATTSDLESARVQLEDGQRELRALRNEEAKAARLEEGLRTAREEFIKLDRQHAAALEAKDREMEAHSEAIRIELQAELDQIADQMAAEQKSHVESVRLDHEAVQNQLNEELGDARMQLTSALRELDALRQDQAASGGQLTDAEQQFRKTRDELILAQDEIERLQAEMGRVQAEAGSLRETANRAEAEMSNELARGVQTAERAQKAELDAASATDRAERAEMELQQVRGDLEEAMRQVAGLREKMTRQGEEAARLAAESSNPELEDVLRVTKERLASSADKIVELEDRAHAAEKESAGARTHIEELETELRHLHMEKAVRALRGETPGTEDGDEEDPAAEAGAVAATASAAPLEDRRASTPFIKELSLDAKKTLTQILGVTLALKHKKPGNEQAPLIKQLSTYTRRLDHTIADLVEADRLAHGDVDLRVRRTDVQALVKRIIEESDIGSDHELEVHAEHLVVAIDPARTEQIIAGLLRGAIERSPAGSPIVVRLESGEGGALISVEDAEASSDASLSPVVARFADAQGGWAKVEGRPEGGSSFRVFLPDGSARSASATPATETDAQGNVADVEIVVDVETTEPEELEPGWPEAAGKLLVQELQKLSREE